VQVISYPSFFIPTLILSGYFVHINTANSNCNDDDFNLLTIDLIIVKSNDQNFTSSKFINILKFKLINRFSLVV